MAANTTTAIAWAVPINIIQLLNNLDAFRATLPAVHTFRLCHAFGKGSISKLPKEIAAMIEHATLQQYLDEDVDFETDWQQAYCCFEKSCNPSSHYMDSAYEQLREDAQALVENALSDEELERMMPEDGDPTEEYDMLVVERMDDLCWDFDGHSDMIFSSKESWEQIFSGNSDRLRPYIQILRKHFGLELFVMHETLDNRSSGYLTRNDKRFYKKQPSQATICYLTLPSQAAQWKSTFDEELLESRIGDSKSGKSALISPESFNLSEKHQSRFSQAMRGLLLKPCVHVSQLQGRLSAFSPGHGYGGLEEAASNDKIKPSGKKASAKKASAKKASAKAPTAKALSEQDLETGKMIASLEQGQWPKLMLLVSTDIQFG